MLNLAILVKESQDWQGLEGKDLQGQDKQQEVAGVRHGRVPHPPESWKKIYKKINKKEKRVALCSAIAATARRDLIEDRGHKVENISGFPIIVSDDIESIRKTKDLRDAYRFRS